ncbi:MAG TPA: hypothetical protein VJV05_05995, partial [Pyrinomonadaceae bacterium]|nr:hypothetical protein [Pyrinomonadaceae bacterium]
GNLPRGVRKVETDLERNDLLDLERTIPNYDRQSLLEALKNSVSLYRRLRNALYDDNITLHEKTETRVMEYFDEIERGG